VPVTPSNLNTFAKMCPGISGTPNINTSNAVRMI
jgi:hypothetical protein